VLSLEANYGIVYPNQCFHRVAEMNLMIAEDEFTPNKWIEILLIVRRVYLCELFYGKKD